MRQFLLLLAIHPVLCLSASEVRPSRDSAWTPQESLRAIELDGPYEAQLVAAEPLVRDPVEICWDVNGRCFVADMIDYPLGGPNGEHLSRIQELIDTNNDGVYDKAVTFADNIDHAQGLVPHGTGLIVTTRTQVLYLEDTDDDGIADKRQPLIAGFNPSFSQLQVASPRWGLDGQLYLNNGLDSKEVYPVVTDQPDQPKTQVARHNLRWDPATNKIHPSSGFGQYGAAFDDWGRHYFSSNRSPVMLSVMPHETMERVLGTGLVEGWENIAPHGPASRIYPLQVTHTTSDAHSGTNTSACGITVYRGDLMPELRGQIFACDPTGQLITRLEAPRARGSTLKTDRIGQKTEFFRSRDEWCRPVNLTTGPDGALYVCDIYRQYIDHARFFPDDFVKNHDMRKGEHHGRIWRIVPKGNKYLRPTETLRDIQDHVGWLSHENSWQRETAHRVMMEWAIKKDGASLVAKALHMFGPTEKSAPVAKAHALWLLARSAQTVGRTNGELLDFVKNDFTPELTENLVLAAARYPDIFTGLQDELRGRAFLKGTTRNRMLYLATTSPDPAKQEEEFTTLASLQMQSALEDPWFQAALLGRYPKHAGLLAQRLISGDFVNVSAPGKVALVRQLAAASAASRSKSDFTQLLSLLQTQPGAMLWWKSALMQGLADGLPKSADEYGGKSLLAFVSHKDESFAESRKELAALLAQIETVLMDASTPLDQRLASLPLLNQRPYASTEPLFKKLLQGDQDPEMSRLAFATLKQSGAEKIAPLLYELLPGASPSLRQEIVSTLANNQKTITDLFQRMERGEVPKTLVDAETRWRYLQSKDPVLKPLAEKLFQRPSADRAAVIAAYLPSTKAKGDAKRGKEVFGMFCITCHSYQGQGIAVGPDISDVRAKEKAALLSDILDPNRMIEARWSAYQVETKDGRTLMGLMEGESADAITLKMPGGARETVSRSQIASQKSFDTSLMPVGLEAGISVEQMADLLAFLCGE